METSLSPIHFMIFIFHTGLRHVSGFLFSLLFWDTGYNIIFIFLFYIFYSIFTYFQVTFLSPIDFIIFFFQSGLCHVRGCLFLNFIRSASYKLLNLFFYLFISFCPRHPVPQIHFYPKTYIYIFIHHLFFVIFYFLSFFLGEFFIFLESFFLIFSFFF